MKHWWQSLDDKITALSRRERVAILLAGLALSLFLLPQFLLEPVTRKIDAAQSTIAGNKTQIQELQQQIENLRTTGSGTVKAKREKELADLKSALESANQQLGMMTNNMVKPDEMLGLIEQLMKKNERIRLLALNTLPISNLQAELQKRGTGGVAVATSQTSGTPVIYRHGTELILEGSYLDLLQYIADLEQLPWRLIWGDMRFKVDSPGSIELTLTLYTLSQDEAWLSL